MNFGESYRCLFEGRGIRRKAWAEGMIVRLPATQADHLVLHFPSGNRMVWSPAASDLYDKQLQKIRDDWEIVL